MTNGDTPALPLAERLAQVTAGIAEAARTAERRPDEITTIVVTKFHPTALVEELYRLGVRNFGENRHQEAQRKAAELANLDVLWHFVGQLQSKKARQVRAYADVIHSVDRSALVEALSGGEPAPTRQVLDCLVQLNLTGDDARGGVNPDAVEPLVEQILRSSALRLRGVMAVAPLDEDPRSAFARVRETSDRVRRMAPDATWISAGMSNDYPAAILEGATHLRIGSAITGNRPAHG